MGSSPTSESLHHNLISLEVTIAIPNHLTIVEQCKTQNPQDWKDAHTGNANTEGFIRKLVPMLKAVDPNYGLNGKRGNVNDISDDAVNYICTAADSAGRTPSGQPCVVIDVIGGAGGPNPTPGWLVFTTAVEGSGANVDPNATPTPIPNPCKVPGYEQIGGDNFYRQEIGVPLQADMQAVGQQLNDGSSVWFSRTIYDVIVAHIEGRSAEVPAIVKKHRNEWRVILGLPVIP